MDQNPLIGIKIGRKKEIPQIECYFFKRVYIFAFLCFAMLDTIQTVLHEPKVYIILSYKPLDLILKAYDNYDTITYNCRFIVN